MSEHIANPEEFKRIEQIVIALDGNTLPDLEHDPGNIDPTLQFAPVTPEDYHRLARTGVAYYDHTKYPLLTQVKILRNGLLDESYELVGSLNKPAYQHDELGDVAWFSAFTGDLWRLDAEDAGVTTRILNHAQQIVPLYAGPGAFADFQQQVLAGSEQPILGSALSNQAKLQRIEALRSARLADLQQKWASKGADVPAKTAEFSTGWAEFAAAFTDEAAVGHAQQNLLTMLYSSYQVAQCLDSVAVHVDATGNLIPINDPSGAITSSDIVLDALHDIFVHMARLPGVSLENVFSRNAVKVALRRYSREASPGAGRTVSIVDENTLEETALDPAAEPMADLAELALAAIGVAVVSDTAQVGNQLELTTEHQAIMQKLTAGEVAGRLSLAVVTPGLSPLEIKEQFSLLSTIRTQQ